MTCLPTAEGWLCPACWLDLATREAVGCAMAGRHRASLISGALKMVHGGPDSARDASYTATAAANTPQPNSALK